MKLSFQPKVSVFRRKWLLRHFWILSRTSVNYRFCHNIGQGNDRFPSFDTESLHICSLISFHRHMASACHVLYSNTDIMLLGLDRCSSVMRLRLMIRDRIFLWINERSTQIVARHEGGASEENYHQKKNHFRKSSKVPCDPSAAVAGSRPEIGRSTDVRPFDFTRGSPLRERGIYRKFCVRILFIILS